MPNKTITDLTAAAALGGTEILPITQSGNSRKATMAQIAAYTRAFITLDSAEVANYVAVSADFAGGIILPINSGSPITVTINTGLTGTEPLVIYQMGAGQVEIVQGSGVTLRSPGNNRKLRLQWSAVTIIPLGSNTFLLSGDLTV